MPLRPVGKEKPAALDLGLIDDPEQEIVQQVPPPPWR
jgi:hypothetical protein